MNPVFVVSTPDLALPSLAFTAKPGEPELADIAPEISARCIQTLCMIYSMNQQLHDIAAAEERHLFIYAPERHPLPRCLRPRSSIDTAASARNAKCWSAKASYCVATEGCTGVL